MKQLVYLFLLLGIVATPHAAQARGTDRAASLKTASQVFWSFAKCAVKRRADDARELLEAYTPDRAGRDAANAFAQRHARCLMPGDKLTMNEDLFIGALSGAYFVRKYENLELPDYADAALVVAPGQVSGEDPAREKIRVMMLAFGECVFRNRTADVRELLKTRPASDEEHAAFGKVLPVLGPCLPVEEGTQLKFSRINLRSVLGEAAYRVDSMLPEPPLVAREAAE